jgi:hypothetical protein
MKYAQEVVMVCDDASWVMSSGRQNGLSNSDTCNVVMSK